MSAHQTKTMEMEAQVKLLQLEQQVHSGLINPQSKELTRGTTELVQHFRL
jgi:hypothetical protein